MFQNQILAFRKIDHLESIFFMNTTIVNKRFITVLIEHRFMKTRPLISTCNRCSNSNKISATFAFSCYHKFLSGLFFFPQEGRPRRKKNKKEITFWYETLWAWPYKEGTGTANRLNWAGSSPMAWYRPRFDPFGPGPGSCIAGPSNYHAKS